MAAGAMALALAALAAAGATPAEAQTYMELEAARANARAGGPISGRDAELLERYGCLSGTKSEFCEKLSERDRKRTRSERRRAKR
ncbi:hypothetical protein [Hyphomicrobium sp. CS1GBMeth3]|uniref:hypothetical protein n=1 Tax=Hyphomicrobium sp. CS1GBMeth3 TaxID=1892845 RepID=UPI001114F564|nr:hypothetical protein [Hyphomicrobium sp. CS1GBMeth3]